MEIFSSILIILLAANGCRAVFDEGCPNNITTNRIDNDFDSSTDSTRNDLIYEGDSRSGVDAADYSTCVADECDDDDYKYLSHEGWQSTKYMQMGDELQRQGQYNDALDAYMRAHSEANTPEGCARAQAAVVRTLEMKNALWHRFIQKCLIPASSIIAYSIIIIAASALLFLLVFPALYYLCGRIGRYFARFSNRIEVGEFKDATDTGFGKALPALLISLYHERRQLSSRNLLLQGSGIVIYRSEHTANPVMGFRNYENFSEITLDIAGVDISSIFMLLKRRLFQPYYSVSGVIYQYNNDIRAVTTLARHNEIIEHWDLILSDGRVEGPLPSNSAYRVIDAIVRDWEQRL